MAILNIRQLGDETLKKKCKTVKEITPRIEQLVEDMFDTMYDAGGVGLAAPQVGILKRIVVIDTTRDPREDEEEVPDDELQCYVMINPEIIEADGEQRGYEGCLSYVGMSGIVTRPNHVIARYTDIDGDEQTVEAEGLLARAICHELDHLEGVMSTEHVEGEVISNEELEKRRAELQAQQDQEESEG